MWFGQQKQKADDYLKVNIAVDKIHEILDKEKLKRKQRKNDNQN